MSTFETEQGAHLSSFLRYPPINIVIVCFYGCLALHDAPQVPCAHHANSETKYKSQYVDQRKGDCGHVVWPEYLE